MREMLLMKSISFLRGQGFEVKTFLDSNSCFDLVANRSDLRLVVKIYSNIDGFRKEQAEELQKIAELFNAIVLVIGEKTKAFTLKKGIVYERHSIPAMNYFTFVSIFDTMVPSMKFFKGKTIVELESDKLKEKRNELDLTLEELAERTGITKESLYRLEHGFKTSLETAKKLEKLLKADLILEKNLLEDFVSVKPDKQVFDQHFDDSSLEKIHSLGLDLIEFNHAPFKAFAQPFLKKQTFEKSLSKTTLSKRVESNPPFSEKGGKAEAEQKSFMVIDKGKEKSEVKRKALVLEKTKAVFNSHSLIITKKFSLKRIASTPIIEEQELDSYSKINQLMDEIKKREKKG